MKPKAKPMNTTVRTVFTGVHIILHNYCSQHSME